MSFLIDLNLPDGEGLGNFETLQELAPELPMIVFNRPLRRERRRGCYRARGASDYLFKGDAPAALLERSISLRHRTQNATKNGRLELVKAQIEREEAESPPTPPKTNSWRRFRTNCARRSTRLWAGLRSCAAAIWTKKPRSKRSKLSSATRACKPNLSRIYWTFRALFPAIFRLEFGEIDLCAIVRATILTLQPQIQDKQLDIQLDLQPVPELCGDPTRLQQVAWNLLSNAIKFTPAQGHLRLSTRQVGERVVLEVSDDGQGIAPDVIAHIFDRFRQADGSTTRRHGGLGLGLAIVRHIVELHHGTVEVSSAGLGQGTTFTITLPMRNATQVIEDMA